MKLIHSFLLMKQHAFLLLFIFSVVNVFCQSKIIASAPGQVSLSEEMVNQYRSIYEYLLQIKLDPLEKSRLTNGLIQYWEKNDSEAIRQFLSDLKYYGKQDELETLRNTSQLVIVEAFRKDNTDSESLVLIGAYDKTHPERIAKTGIKVFADIVGTWRKTDGLVAERTYISQPAGVSYTESETLEISPDGTYTYIKVHTHYSGSCTQQDGTTEKGIVKIKGNKIFFKVLSGSGIVTDNCIASLKKRIKVIPRTDVFIWTIRDNINNTEVQTICLNKSDGTAVCLDKQ